MNKRWNKLDTTNIILFRACKRVIQKSQVLISILAYSFMNSKLVCQGQRFWIMWGGRTMGATIHYIYTSFRQYWMCEPMFEIFICIRSPYLSSSWLITYLIAVWTSTLILVYISRTNCFINPSLVHPWTEISRLDLSHHNDHIGHFTNHAFRLKLLTLHWHPMRKSTIPMWIFECIQVQRSFSSPSKVASFNLLQHIGQPKLVSLVSEMSVWRALKHASLRT